MGQVLTGVGNPRDLDPWFWSHYEDAAGIVATLAPPECLARGKTIVDFGCGDGATALGLARKVEAQVVGLDLYRSFDRLADLARKNLGAHALPSNLSFKQNELSQPLPLDSGAADLIYSWSVFEHLSDMKGVLRELHRISRPGGYLFIQVEPLFYSPFGSHLRRLVDEPWAHLQGEEEAYLARVAAARDHVPAEEQDVLYRTHEFEEVKRHLIAEYRSLNRITAEELLQAVAKAGFDVAWKKLMSTPLDAPPGLAGRFPLEDLKTDQVVLLARKA